MEWGAISDHFFILFFYLQLWVNKCHFIKIADGWIRIRVPCQPCHNHCHGPSPQPAAHSSPLCSPMSATGSNKELKPFWQAPLFAIAGCTRFRNSPTCQLQTKLPSTFFVFLFNKLSQPLFRYPLTIWSSNLVS